MLAAGCLDGTVHVSPASRPEVGAILPHPDAVTTVEFGDADGRTMLATACVDGNIRLWDPVQPSAPRATVNGRIGSVALVARGRTVDVVTGNDQAKLHWWSGDDGRRRLEIDLAQTRLGTRNDPAWSPRAAVAAGYVDGRLIALTSCLNAVKCWELGDPERDQPRAMRTYEGRSAALYVGNGRALFARTKASAIVVYDAFTGRQTQLGPMSGIRLPARFDGLKFHTSRGRIFLTVVANGRLTLLDFEHQTLADAPVEGVAADAYIALGTLEGRPVLAILRPYELRLCDAASGKDQIAPIRTSPTARAVAFARLGQRDIVVTAHSATIRAWNPFTGRMLTQLPLGTNLDAMAVCDSPDGTAQVAIGGPGLLLAELHEAQAGR
jgi:WD40 repeat protein